MIINSEQEMLNFGKKFAQELASDWNITFRDRTRLTRSGMSEASPVTTGRSERVEKGPNKLPLIVRLLKNNFIKNQPTLFGKITGKFSTIAKN